MIHKPQHHFKIPFPIVNDALLVGGIDLERLCLRAGNTPFFVYDKSIIRRQVERIRKAFPHGIALHYAIKANPMPALVQYVATLVDGLDVASQMEMRTALDTAQPAQHISFAGPGKKTVELASALATGVLINVESAQELERIAALSQQHHLASRVAIRVNPDFELKTSGMKMTGGPKQFGVDTEQVPALLQRIQQLGLDFEGFHIYSGSQNLRHDAIIEAQTKTLQLAIQLAQHTPSPIKIVNIGGGFGIPYFPGDTPLQLEPIAQHLQKLQKQCRQALPAAKLVIELGRYLVGEAGIYVCRVLERKISKGQVFLITDGGLHHQLAASGNFGQVIRKNYPIVVGNKVHGLRRETCSVAGPLCTPLDLLADKLEMAEAQAGDFIVVFLSGAYGLSASPQAFLSHPQAVEMLV